MADRLGVGLHPVNVTPVRGEALDDLKKHLQVMEKAVGHLLTAVRDMKNGISAGNNRLLTSGVMNSRNWALSVVTSHCYVQFLLGANPGDRANNSVPIARFQLYDLFMRAAELGANDALATRKRLNVRPTDPIAQMKWDGKVR